MAYPPPFIVEPQPGHPHTHTAILLHGRSSTAEEFATDLFSLKTSTPQRTLPECFPFFRWVFPDAGQRWCTLFRGKQSAWFDTFSLDDLSERQDLQVSGLRDGIHFVKSTLEKEVENLGGRAERVILGGFSQGSATVLWSLFTGAAMGNGRLGAFVGLGAWMPFTREAKKAVSVEDSIISRDQRAGNLVASFSGILGIDSLSSADVGANLQQTPVYLGHGTDDMIVNVSNCHDLCAIFGALGSHVESREYLGAERKGHWVKDPEQLDDIVAFLVKIVGNSNWDDSQGTPGLSRLVA